MKHILILGAIWLLSSSTVSAASFVSGETVRVDNSGDIYVAGTTVTMKSALEGDLIGAAQYLTIDEEVSQDANIAAQKIQITAPIGDDLRVAGDSILINADVAGDVLIFANSVTISEGVTIGGDLVVYASVVTINGIVEGSLRTGTDNLVLAGTVGGNADINTRLLTIEGTIEGDATIVTSEKFEVVTDGEAFLVEGDLTYYAPEQIDLNQNVRGDVYYDESLKRNHTNESTETGLQAALFSSLLIVRLLSAGVVILTMMLLANRFFRKASESLTTGESVASSFGWGSVVLFLPPVAILILLISGIGIPVGLFAGAVYTFLLFFSGSAGALFLSHLLNVQTSMEASNIRIYLMSLGIYVLTMVIGFIPGINILAWLLISLITWGALVYATKN